MLLSHNFNLASGHAPALSRESFTQVFIDGLKEDHRLKIRLIDHPHWITELLFDTNAVSPQHVGALCAEALLTARKLASPAIAILEILTLGGLKTTPPTSNAPDTLQPGDWGVDVVETLSGKTFLQELNWDDMVSQKPEGHTFVVSTSL